MDNLRRIGGVVVLGKDGQRLMAQYNPLGVLADREAQNAFEAAFAELARAHYGEARKGLYIACLEEHLVLFSAHSDLYILLVAERAENALRLEGFLTALSTAFTLLCGKEVSVAAVQRNYCELLLLLDESIDRGMLLTCSAEEMVARVQMQEYAPAPKPAGGRSAIKGLFSLIG